MSIPVQLDLIVFPPQVTPRGDGTFLVKPGRPVVAESRITVKEACRLLRCSRDSIYRYVNEGLLTASQVKPNARLWLVRSEVLALAQTERGGNA